MLSDHSLSGGECVKTGRTEEDVQPQEDGEEGEKWSSRTRSESSGTDELTQTERECGREDVELGGVWEGGRRVTD